MVSLQFVMSSLSDGDGGVDMCVAAPQERFHHPTGEGTLASLNMVNNDAGPSSPFPLPWKNTLDYVPKASHQDIFLYLVTSSS